MPGEATEKTGRDGRGVMPTLSFRTRILALVLGVAVIPLAVIGFWVTSSAARSGEEILVDRLNGTLQGAGSEIAESWLRLRSDLLDFAGSSEVQGLLDGGATDRLVSTTASSQAGSPGLRVPPALDSDALMALAVEDVDGTVVWSEARTPGVIGAGFRVDLPVYRERTNQRLGTLAVDINLRELAGELGLLASPTGSVLAATDPATGASLLPVPFDPQLLESDRFLWGGDEWMVRTRRLGEPRLELMAAAPLTPLTVPFQAAARRGLVLLLLVALGSVVLAVVLTGRMTRSLAELAAAADGVSEGDLDRRVEPGRTDEVGRVGRAFNEMTENLQSTLRQLADRQALAAVGEFAASLSHEVRNALTSIRLDMQVAGEHLPEDPEAKEPLDRALQEIARLDETVSGSLALARGGKVRKVPLDLRGPLESAVRAARPEFESRGVTLRRPELPEPVPMEGDPGGLEQVFLNLLLNAAQASPAGGQTHLEVDSAPSEVSVTVRDEGPGIPTAVRERVFEPLYSTREEGTGLGLPIARRIVQGHGGKLVLDDAPGGGTVAIVHLPVGPPSPAPST
jgi:signal transduction histidine kinase